MKELKKKSKKLLKKEIFSKKFKLEDQKVILNNISTVLNQGYSLNETIKLLSYRFDIQDYLDELSEGTKFSQVLKEKNYDRDILLILEIAEESGNLTEGINKAISVIEAKIDNKGQILEAIKYPLILGSIMLISIWFISKFMIPMFLNVYKDFDIELGSFSKIFFGSLLYLPYLIYFLGAVIIIFLIFMKIQTKSKRVRILTKNKIIKKQYFKIYNQIFLLNVATLLDLGLKLDEVFKILGNQEHNHLLKTQSVIILKKLQEGETLSEILKIEKIYGKGIISAVSDGEKYGVLAKNLKNYLLITESEKEKRFKKYLFLAQPIFYCFFGFIILVLYASIFIPMFKIMDQL